MSTGVWQPRSRPCYYIISIIRPNGYGEFSFPKAYTIVFGGLTVSYTDVKHLLSARWFWKTTQFREIPAF